LSTRNDSECSRFCHPIVRNGELDHMQTWRDALVYVYTTQGCVAGKQFTETLKVYTDMVMEFAATGSNRGKADAKPPLV
jgi:hypothetical protein